MVDQLALDTRKSFAHDPLRPHYHFLPPSNWMNDPNGFIQWRGKYHLFYQHNPFGPLWGNMHWGHASSHDLIHWEDLPIALAPTPGGPDESGCFSGCAVDNGVPTFFYTGTRGQFCEIQTQCTATGDNDLIHWRKSPHNPVLSQVPDVSNQTRDFRDPYVWKEADAWYMVVGSRIADVGGAVFLYRSSDLINWHYLHPLLVGDIKRNGVIWECPNFFQLDGQWILVVSAHVGNATDTVLYFVGSYENHQFTPVYEGVLDYGQFYAPLAILDEQQRRVMMGWLREARSAERMEKAGWSGVQSIPRILSLHNNRLLMRPVSSLESIRQHPLRYRAADIPADGYLDLSSRALDIHLESNPQPAGEVGISVACSRTSQARLDITYDPAAQRLFIHNTTSDAEGTNTHASANRSIAHQFGFQEHVGEVKAGATWLTLSQSLPHTLAPNEPLRLRILLDASVVEIIANERTSMVFRLYTTDSELTNVRVVGTYSAINTIEIHEMSSIWQNSQS